MPINAPALRCALPKTDRSFSRAKTHPGDGKNRGSRHGEAEGFELGFHVLKSRTIGDVFVVLLHFGEKLSGWLFRLQLGDCFPVFWGESADGRKTFRAVA